MKNITISVAGILFLLLGALASAQVTTYCCDQAAEDAYLAALAAQHPSATIVHESFESGSWVNVRSPNFSPSVSNLGITWSQNDDGLTTNNFNSSDGNYQMFTYDAVFTHTEPDGYTITGDAGVLFGVGGWFSGTGTKLSFVVDGDPNRVNFTGEEATVSDWQFLGFIDSTPFASVEVVRVDEVGNETNWFWSDDFNIATQEGPGTLQFSATDYSVSENGTSITITVDRVGGSAGAVSVGYSTTDGSATASSDYSPASGTLNFADGVTTQTFNVSILDDTSYEGDEAFTVNLAGANGGATIGTPSSATVTITENDPAPSAGTLQFDNATYSVAENATSLLVTVTRTGGSFGAVSASYSTTDGSATAGSDYSTASGTVNFADGVVSQSFTISILNDTTYEGDEAFAVNLSGATGGATIGTPSSATVTITENDPTPPAGTLQFGNATYSVAENGNSLQVTVTRAGGSFGAVSAGYSSTDGSAAAGSDYTAASGTVNFADGVLSQTFTVGILDDTTWEGDEDFTLSLSGPTGGATIGTPSTTTVTIAEDDPTPPAGALQFSGATYSVAENGTSLLVTVTRTGGSFGAVTVDYASADGSATAASDYSAASGTLNFADGVISQTFSVGILDDTTWEGDEDFTLGLSNATNGASIGTPSTATVTITEDDPTPPAGTLQFSGATYSVAENGTSLLVTVTRTGGSFGAVSVDYASADGSAAAASDYSAASGTLNFANGVISQTFSVGILDDTTWEGDEDFTLGLSNATGGASIGTPSTATVTISEDDPTPPAGELRFESASYAIAENGTSLLVTVTRTGGSFGAVSATYGSVNGTATAGSDYSAASGTVNFADGVTSQTFSVGIIDDTTYEGDEDFTLGLSNATGGATIGAPSTATVTITEDDPTPPAGELQFNSATYSVAESGTSLLVTVTRTGGSFGAVSASYSSTDGSATAGSDYSTASGTVNFADGVLSQTFSVGILDDTSYEGDETFTLNLSGATGGATIGTPATATVTITENDPTPPAGTLQFGNATYSVAENGTSLMVTVTRTGGSFGAVSASYSSTDGSATAGNDYAAAIGTVDFADGVVSQTFSVGILDDTSYEGDEAFSLNLSGATGGATIGTPSTATVTITEDDPTPPAGTLQFASASYSIAENGTSLLVTVTRTGGSFGAVSASYSTTDGTATAGGDYSTASGTVNFADGVMSQTFSVGILDDADYEGDEAFSLILSGATGGAAIGMPSTATVTITENDPTPPAGTLQFSGATYSVAENGTSLVVTVTRTGGSFGAVSVGYVTVDGSATAGNDYNAASGTLNFADGVISQTITVGILDDAAFEGNETFTLNLAGATGGATIGTPSMATVTINDDDPAPPAGTLQFSGATYSIAENGTSLVVTVTRTGGSFGAVSVDYASTDGSATAGSDYGSAIGTLNFAGGETSQNFTVSILDDTDYEGDEDFTLNLSGATGGATIGTPSTATVTITENDPTPPAGTLQFSGATYSVAENGTSLLVTVTRTGGSFGAVSASYGSVDGSATAGSDYTAAGGSVNFADGVISQSFSVGILDDMTYEGDETFTLNLSAATGGASIGAPSSASVTITEDDVTPPAGTLQFSSSGYTVAENGGSVLVTVTRAGGSFGAVSVDYDTSDGAALAGSDYTTASGTLNFANGEISQSFNVAILDDATYEGDEIFGVGLSNATGGASIGSPFAAAITITEDDAAPPSGSLQFALASDSVAENGVSINVSVTRTGGSFGAVSVDYSSTDGTATAATDYTPASGTLNFADGETSQSFTVSILDDATYEGDEDFALNLANAAGGASLGAPASMSVTITEDDAAPAHGSLQFSNGTYSVAENGGMVTVTVTRTGGSDGTVSVDYATGDGTAVAGSDYSPASGWLIFDDGVVSQSFDVTILDDTTYEGPESLGVSLSAVTGGATIGTPSSATISISEDDPVPSAGSLQFSGSQATVAEDAAAIEITVNRVGGSFGAVTIDYETVDDTAIGGGDYTSVADTLSFAAGEISKSFFVPITDDAIYEGDEQFTARLLNPTGDAVLGAPATTTITITDDDPVPSAGSLQLSGASYSIAEDGGSVRVTVTRTGGSFGSVGVDLATSDGTATAGTDYTSTMTTVTLPDGVTSQSVDIAITDDATFEGDETFTVALSNASGGASLSNPATATVTIVEDDVPPAAGNLKFSGATYTVREDAGTVQITVTRTGGSFGVVGVDYSSSDGSATAGSDYMASTGTLTFADGEVSQLIDLTITDDSVYEGQEDFTMQLSNASGGATIGSPSSATVRISENESRPPITPPPKKGGGGAIGPLGLLLALLCFLVTPVFADTDPHAGHRKAMSSTQIGKSLHSYNVADLQFVAMDGRESTLGEVMNTGNPVIVNFIFTTCTTICPVQTATFAQVQRKLGERANDVTMISVSIDPEHDTPSRLRDYSQLFDAGPQWQFLTGSVQEMIDIQKAFEAYHGAKMNHRPLVLIKAPDDEQWLRLEGMAGASDILEELQDIMSRT